DISFVGTEQFRVRVKSSDKGIQLYNKQTSKTLFRAEAIELDTILPLASALKTSFLYFSLKDVDPEVFSNREKYFIKIRSLDQVAQQYESQLSTSPISANANIMKLSLTTIVPYRAINFLQTLCDVYIGNDLRRKNRLGERTIEFIDYQLQGVTDSLRRAESSLESFRHESNIMDVNVTSQNLSQKLSALEEQQALLSVQNKYYRYIERYLTKNENAAEDIVAPSSVGIQDQLLSSLILQLTQLNQERISRSYNSKQLNPALQVLEKKINMTKTSLKGSINNLIGTNEISLEENKQRINSLRNSISRLPQNERSLTDITRKFNFNDNIYNYLIQKRAEAGIAIASNLPDKRIVDYPRQIKKLGPNPIFAFLLAIIAGLFLPAGIVFAKDFFDPKLENIEQLTSITNIPVLEKVANVSVKEKKLGALGNGYVAHSFRYVRQQITALKRSRNVKTIGITSPVSGEGKTFCSLNLAMSLTGADYKTLLIDLDLQQSKLSREFAVNAKPGITDYLTNGKSNIVQHTHIEKLDIITAGTPLQNPSDLLNNQSLEKLINLLREKYDFIIVDTPPVGIIADYLVISKIIDYTIIIIRNDYSKRDSVRRIDKLVKDYALPSGIIYNGTKVEYSYGAYNNYMSKVAR
ncbi:MAG TPA: polysaccharide biosynthesis tyrosine autokinase, partial [Chryseolinea sp.]|nr:polysaccharide biosynthesis tyrosine autokinase [Chryseolinea sp.]